MNVAEQIPVSSSATYAVPKRFGMAGILAIMTLMAVLFGALRSFDAHPGLYVFLGMLALVTCLVQMRYGDVPRMASIAAGSLLLPVCAVTLAMFGGPHEALTVLCSTPVLAAFGALFGYLAGACTAGVFLLLDLVEGYVSGGNAARYARPAPPRPAALPFGSLLKSLVSDDAPPPSDNPFAPKHNALSDPPQAHPEDIRDWSI